MFTDLYNYKTVIECVVKDDQNIFYWVKKKDLFGVFLDIEGHT
jgi:hypothetical protein